jgi:uncharacterized RDD family membrane protein YckC
VEGDPRQQDERFAEWYVWAKREVATDSRVCLAAAQAALEAQEGGADQQAARAAARGSTFGHGVALLSRITPRRRAYAEWYDWARREVGGGRERQHEAARAALDRLDAGSDAAGAAAAAHAAAGAPPPPGTPLTTAPTSPWAPPAPTVASASPWSAPSTVSAPAPSTVSAPALPPAPGSVAPPPPVAPAHHAYALAPPPPPLAPSHTYAGFGRRLGAWAIDTVLLLVGFFVVYFVGSIFIGLGLLSSGQDLTVDNALGAELVLLLIMGVLAWLYYAGLESSAWQGTVGKRILRLVVTDLYGRRISFGRATGRFFAKIVSALALGVGYLMVIFTERRQGLHDLMAGTLVVRQEHLSLLTMPPAPAPAHQSGQPGGAGEVQGA